MGEEKDRDKKEISEGIHNLFGKPVVLHKLDTITSFKVGEAMGVSKKKDGLPA